MNILLQLFFGVIVYQLIFFCEGGEINVSQKTISARIAEMYDQLNQLIESNNYDLMNDKVQQFSRELDKLIIMYSQSQVENGKSSLLNVK